MNDNGAYYVEIQDIPADTEKCVVNDPGKPGFDDPIIVGYVKPYTKPADNRWTDPYLCCGVLIDFSLKKNPDHYLPTASGADPEKLWFSRIDQAGTDANKLWTNIYSIEYKMLKGPPRPDPVPVVPVKEVEDEDEEEVSKVTVAALTMTMIAALGSSTYFAM